MKSSHININKKQIKIQTLNTVIVGTGASGYNAADRLHSFGQTDIAIISENILAGTSRNTGSDKQTYYKLTLSGDDTDSVREMAQTLFDGQCVDGDIALCEAALSSQCFLKLAELGVPFPQNRYGEFIGYKTDHDPRRRATSVGPYTSKLMTQCLEKSVFAKNILVLDNLQVVRILKKGDEACGLLCLNNKTGEYVAFNCKNIIYATGGPAGMYSDSVYPHGHYGSTGIAFEAGIIGKNLTEWQYGLASLHPRWNVSGTYMQVLPRFISRDAHGNDEREFLLDFFDDKNEMLTKVFLKGYQWPFDINKISDGSSIIDILVYLETCKGRKVYLDFTKNPADCSINFESLSQEAYSYLNAAEACFGTPYDRLLHMNSPAVQFYEDKGVSLFSEPLEIALCAQHNNGGLDIDCWWQTNVKGFFAVGEVAASHGVYRPGGSALNAGQVGSTRAAQFIAAKRDGEALPLSEFEHIVSNDIAKTLDFANSLLSDTDNAQIYINETALSMSKTAAAIRNRELLESTLSQVNTKLNEFTKTIKVSSIKGLVKAYRLYDILLCQIVYINAMLDYIDNGGKSRGSAFYTDKKGVKPYEQLPDEYTFITDDNTRGGLVQEIHYANGKCLANWRQVRPMPCDNSFFENVWREYRKNKNIV